MTEFLKLRESGLRNRNIPLHPKNWGLSSLKSTHLETPTALERLPLSLRGKILSKTTPQQGKWTRLLNLMISWVDLPRKCFLLCLQNLNKKLKIYHQNHKIRISICHLNGSIKKLRILKKLHQKLSCLATDQKIHTITWWLMSHLLSYLTGNLTLLMSSRLRNKQSTKK